MSEETVVQPLDSTEQKVNPKETTDAAVSGEVDPQGNADQGEHGNEEKKRKGGWQRRQEKTERERDYWRNVALQNAPKPVTEAKVEAKPKPNWQEYETAGKQEQFFEDLADWKAEQKLAAFKEEQKAEAQKRETQTESEAQAERWNQSAAEFRKEHSDFDEVIAQANPSDLLSSLVARNKDAVQIAYHLANNPDLEAQLSRMTDPVDVAQELGLIRARLAQEKPADEEEEIASPPPAKPLPKPPTPVTKSAVSKRFDPLDPSSYGDFATFEKHMNERDKRRTKG